MTKLEVCPGICGLTAIITASVEDDELSLSIDTKCAGCRKLVDAICEDDELEAFDLVFNKPGEGPVYEAASEHCLHGACPVPCGIIKCVEAEANLALKKEVTFRFIEE